MRNGGVVTLLLLLLDLRKRAARVRRRQPALQRPERLAGAPAIRMPCRCIADPLCVRIEILLRAANTLSIQSCHESESAL